MSPERAEHDDWEHQVNPNTRFRRNKEPANNSKSNKENAQAKQATGTTSKEAPAPAKQAPNPTSSRPKPRPKRPQAASANALANSPLTVSSAVQPPAIPAVGDAATLEALREQVAALQSQVSERDAQINRLQNLQAASAPQADANLIPTPATRPYGPLQDAMRLNNDKDLYNDCQAVVRDTLKQQYEAYKAGWRQQEPTFLHEVRTLAEQRMPYLKRYKAGWATYEIMKSIIKNGRQYRNLQELKRNPGLRAEKEAKKAAAKVAKAAQAKAGGNKDGEKGGNGAKAKAGGKGNREKCRVDDGHNDDGDSESDDSSSDLSSDEGSESGEDSKSADEDGNGDDEEEREDDDGDQDVEEDEAEEDTAMEQDNGGDNEGEDEAAGDNKGEGEGADDEHVEGEGVGNEAGEGKGGDKQSNDDADAADEDNGANKATRKGKSTGKGESRGKGRGKDKSGEVGVDRAGDKRKRLDRKQAGSNKRARHEK
ncbi:hypothetical protein BJ165DRAFT_1553676 [Panaeolus papilionaceus]|nr:hypothetical protein BJ165DRAFT_1553676 [Panaeolus papilionaceus]